MYFTRGYDDLYKTMLQDVVENTPVTNLSESSTARALIESTARQLAALHANVDVYSRMAFVTTAGGEELDRLGALHGIARGQATRAYSSDQNFRFYIDPRYEQHTISDLLTIANDNGANLPSIVIKKGTVVSVSGSDVQSADVTYTTTASVTLTNTGVYVPVIATGVGAAFNVGIGALTKHNIGSNQPELSSISRYITCGNDEEPIETGRSYESDADYRARIMDARLANQNGNEAAVRWAALSVPGVATVMMNSAPEGPGTFGVVVITNYAVPSHAVLAAVEQAVGNVAAYGMRAIVTTPELLAIELKITLLFQQEATLEDRDLIRREVRTAIIDYTNNIEVGGEWIANEVIQRVMDVSTLIKDLSQEYFRVTKFQGSMGILTSGKAQTQSSVDVFRNLEGNRIIWGNMKCKNANPPQKFLMLGRHLVVC